MSTSTTTSKPLKPKRGTTAQNNNYTGEAYEVTLDTDKKTLVVHDGLTAGGFPLAKEADLTALTTTQAAKDAEQDAAIAGKLSTSGGVIENDLTVNRDIYIGNCVNAVTYALNTDIVDGERPSANKGTAFAAVDKDKTKCLGSVSYVQLSGGFQGWSLVSYKGSQATSFDLGVDAAGSRIGRVACDRFTSSGSLQANDGRMRLDRLDSSEYDHYRIYDPTLGKGVWADFGRFTGAWARLLTENDRTVPSGIFADISWVPDAIYTAPADGFIAYRGGNNHGSNGVWNLDFYDSNYVWLFSVGSSVTNGSSVGMLIPVSAGMLVVPRAGARVDCLSFRFIYTKGL